MTSRPMRNRPSHSTASKARRSRGSLDTGTSVRQTHLSPIADRARRSTRSCPASRRGEPATNVRIETSRPTAAPQRASCTVYPAPSPLSQSETAWRDTRRAWATATCGRPAASRASRRSRITSSSCRRARLPASSMVVRRTPTREWCPWAITWALPGRYVDATSRTATLPCTATIGGGDSGRQPPMCQ
jgi:hypothetical protein